MKLTANNRLLIVRHFKAGASLAECAETYGKTLMQIESVIRDWMKGDDQTLELLPENQK